MHFKKHTFKGSEKLGKAWAQLTTWKFDSKAASSSQGNVEMHVPRGSGGAAPKIQAAAGKDADAKVVPIKKRKADAEPSVVPPPPLTHM